MRLKLPFLLLFCFVGGYFSVQNSQALSCANLESGIGVVSSISPDDHFPTVVLSGFDKFKESELDHGKIGNIDQYENIAKEYAKNYLQNSKKPSSTTISFSSNAFNLANIKIGDIVVYGPPYGNPCAYGFSGIFARDGRLTAAIIGGEGSIYKYRGSSLEANVGKIIQCSAQGKCATEVNFNIDGELFQLPAGKKYNKTTGSIQSVQLSNSSKDYFGSRIDYVIYFRNLPY